MHIMKNSIGNILCIFSDKICISYVEDRLYGLVVRVPDYRSRGPGSIPSAARFSEK
jgi:hypothetical protein